jgi:hypothetical protein
MLAHSRSVPDVTLAERGCKLMKLQKILCCRVKLLSARGKDLLTLAVWQVGLRLSRSLDSVDPWIQIKSCTDA